MPAKFGFDVAPTDLAVLAPKHTSAAFGARCERPGERTLVELGLLQERLLDPGRVVAVLVAVAAVAHGADRKVVPAVCARGHPRSRA